MKKKLPFSRTAGLQHYFLKMNTLADIFVEQFEEHLFYRTSFGGYFSESELNICIMKKHTRSPLSHSHYEKKQRASLSLVFIDILSCVNTEHHQSFPSESYIAVTRDTIT